VCPEEFAQRITDAAGVNLFDEPNFRLVWGESSTIRAGGAWNVPGLDDVEHYRGYRDVLEDGNPQWLLQQWMPAEFWGSPARWYIDNFDDATGLQTLGGYPYSGRYLTVFPVGQRLDEYIVDLVIPVIVWSKQITEAQKRAVVEERRARSEAAQVAQIEDSLRNAFPALGEIRSAAGLSCLSIVQKKVEQIERHWQAGIEFVQQRGRGLSIVN
jgi:hypothetical protein